jgi:PAS domain S-box-containing protein
MAPSTDTISVLHVDEPSVTDVVASALERDGAPFVVHTATTHEEGLETVATGDVDCVVAGYDIPGGDGISLLDAVRDADPGIPFVLHADRRSEGVGEEALRAGATDYVPTDEVLDRHALLAARIRNAVERTRATRQVEAARRIGRVVRELNEALARATTREEVDDRVCAILSDAEPYRFAWIGEHDVDSRTVEPRSSAGVAEEYLEAVEIRTDERPTGLGPTGRAVRSGEVAVMQNIRTDPEYEPWREAALERGYRSSAAIPLIYDDTLYGVLNVYADRPDAFDDRERRLLSSAGETITHAYRRIELQRQYTDQYRTLFEEAPVMVVFTEAAEDGPIIEDCNPAFAEHLGYTREELRGTPLSEHYTDRSAEQLLEGGYDRALVGEFVREQRTLVARDGTETLTVLRAAPRRDRDGDIVGTHALFLDITDEVQIRKLERQNERLEEFAGVLSHDLRNPLNVAQGRLELVAETCDSEDIPHIRHAHERMEALIEDLLTLAREGAAVTDPGVVDLAALAEGCWANVDTSEATLEIETDRSVLADGSRLKRVFENLVRNSVEHGGPDVTVRIGDLPDEAGFYVADDGPGIPEADREAVFEAGHSTNEDGTGFGLSIVQGIVEAHDWSVRVTESDDGGARFEITGVEYAPE